MESEEASGIAGEKLDQAVQADASLSDTLTEHEAEQRLDAERKRLEVGISTSFLVAKDHGRVVIYSNRVIRTYLDLQAMNKTNVLLRLEEFNGKVITTSDQILQDLINLK